MNAPNRNIVQLFLDAAAKYPTHKAIIEGKLELTFAALEEQVFLTAGDLHKKGIGRGDRVLVFVPMGSDLYRIVLAIFLLGATAVFLDEWVSKERLEICCRIAKCKGFVGVWKARVFAFFSMELRKIPVRSGTSLSNGVVPIRYAAQVEGTETALITFTTGSTGTPKAAKRTHGFLHAQFLALTDKIDPKPGDVNVTILPIVLLLNLGVGATSVIVPFKSKKADQMNSRKILNIMEYHRVSRLTASPFFVKQLAIYGLQHAISLTQLRYVFTGGAPVFPDEAHVYLQGFPNATIEVIYGSTEAEPMSAVSAGMLTEAGSTQRGLLVGKPYRQSEVKIISMQDGAISCATENDLKLLELPNGTVGEIIVAGPHVLTSYVNDEESLRRNKIFVQGKCWHRTGDSGFLTEAGFLYLTGRCEGLIMLGDQLLSPFVYENRLQQLPGVSMGTIVWLNNQLVMVIQTDHTADKAAISRLIGQWQLPAELIWMKGIPRDLRHQSKIDYTKLKRMLLRQGLANC